MAWQRRLQTSFASGQLSDRLATRTDAKIYQQGAKTLLNTIPMQQGGASRRGGTWRRAVFAEDRRIIGRVYSRSEAVLMAFGNGALDILDPTTGVAIASFTTQPWNNDTIWFMSVAHFGNFTVICDESFKPRVLQRLGPNSYALDELVWGLGAKGQRRQPRYKMVADAVMLGASGWTGNVTITASAPVFNALHVGEHFRLRNSYFTVTGFTSATAVSATLLAPIETILDPAPFRSLKGSTIVTILQVNHGLRAGDVVGFANTADFAFDQNEANPYNMDGEWTVVSVIDSNHFTVNYTQKVPGDTGARATEDGGGGTVLIRTAAATADWAEPVYSTFRGWPQACAFYQSRLWLAGGRAVPDSVWGSERRTFFAFDPGEGGPNDAVVAVAETQANNIRHLVPGKDMLVLGDNGEAALPSSDVGITQETVRGEPASTEIGAAYVTPLIHDGTTMFCDVIGQHVYEFIYSAELRGYTPTPLSSLCPEIVRQPRSSCAYKGAQGIATAFTLWPNAGDGTLSVFSSRRAEAAAGWMLWKSDGTYLSAAGLNERLFVSVRRGNQCWVEEMDWSWLARADGCVRLASGTPATIWDGSTMGAEVSLDVFTAAGAYLERVITDATGQFETATAHEDIMVGRPFTCRIETLPPAIAFQDGEMLGEVTSIRNAVVHFWKTVHAVVQDEVFTTRNAADILALPQPFSGPREYRNLGHGRAPTVVIESDLPERLGVLGVLVEAQG